MKLGFIIVCRYNSTRLPGKILRTINGKTILQYIYEKLNCVIPSDNIIIASSKESSDDPIARFCDKNGYKYYRGSLNNVAERFLACAEENKFDYATRINGDNIFVDINVLSRMSEIALNNKYDFISNVKNRTFPRGMSIEIVRTTYYSDCYNNFTDDGHYEHVTSYLYQHDKNKNHFYYKNDFCPNAAGIQLAIDTEEDFIIAKEIISNFTLDHTNYGLTDIYKILHEK